MKIVTILLCMMLGGCAKCAYGYSSACDVDSAEDQKQNEEPSKEKEKDPPAGWN